MSRILRAIVLLLLVASCGGGGNNSAPSELDNACTIVKQRKNFYRAFKRTERKWGVPVHVQMAMIYQESKFVADARTPLRFKLGVIPMGRQSSAFGFSQALDGTWKDYQRATGKRGAKRDDIADATDFMGWYMNESKEITGIPLSDTRNQYLAYHDGPSGYLRGTYRKKAWLLRVANEVADRGEMYKRQLARCRVRG